jgi:NADP-dependent 3-hydroxy acid dehydrogenase YdfG
MDGAVVVITGASAGIGAATAELLAGRGMSLVLAARRRDALQAVAARCGPRALPVVADVGDRAQVRRVVTEALSRFGRIDVWINNVGQGISRAPSELTDQDVDEVMRQNVMSALYGMQEVLPHFKARGAGHVINVSSMLGRIPFATFRSAYCGAKHFLNALTAAFRDEVQQTHPGIQVSLVSTRSAAGPTRVNCPAPRARKRSRPSSPPSSSPGARTCTPAPGPATASRGTTPRSARTRSLATPPRPSGLPTTNGIVDKLQPTL